MITPPAYVIEAARCAAIESPCQKSQRGVVAFDRCAHLASELHKHFVIRDIIFAAAANGQPNGFSCDDSASCRQHCAKLCIHAEQRAIMQALVHSGDRECGCSMADLELVHVKVIDGQVVGGGGPSCWQCSRLVVEIGLRGVWLYELPAGDLTGHDLRDVVGEWRFYTADEFHRETLRACGIGDAHG